MSRRSSADRTCGSEAGFTLIETVVALAIAALCLLLLSGIVTRLASASKTVRTHAAVLDEARSITRLIAGLVGSVDLEMQGASTSNLRGGEQELDVLSGGPAVLDLAAETLFKLRFRPAAAQDDPGSGTLSLEWTGAGKASFNETVAEGIKGLKLAYQGRAAAGVWTGVWSKSVADLALVRATIKFSAVREGEPISATFAVHTKLPQACVLNPLRAGCPQW